MNSEEIADVYFCPNCGAPFTKLGDKFRHIAAEHKSEPAPENSPETAENARDIVDL